MISTYLLDDREGREHVCNTVQRGYRVRVQMLPFQRAGLQGGGPGLPVSERGHKVKVSSWKAPSSHCAAAQSANGG